MRRKTLLQWLSIVAIAFAVIYPPAPASATGTGISGFSGKSGSTCTSCHSTGTAPTVTLTGPTSVTSGSINTYTMTVLGAAGQGGLDVAASAGTFTSGTGSKILSGEVVHSSPGGPIWTFTWTAPTVTTTTTATLYAAGINSFSGGTGTVQTNVTVTASAPPPPSNPSLTVSPAELSFSYTVGGTAPAGAQSITVGSSGSALSYTIGASTTTGGNWLSAGDSGSTPGNVSVSVSPTSLSAGTYNGSVTITSSGASNSPLTVPVTLTVSSSTPPPPTGGSLTVSRSRLVFYADGSNPPSDQMLFVSTGSSEGYTVEAFGGSWLSVSSPGSNSSSGKVSVSADATGLPAGTYAGVVQIKAGGSAKNVEVVLVVASSSSGRGGERENEEGDENEDSQVLPFRFDPGAQGSVSAGWFAGAGVVRSGKDPTNRGLFLKKQRSGPPAAIAGAVIKGAAGSQLSQLGFDLRADSECTAKAPQFVVVTADSVTHVAGCAHGSASSLPVAGWKRVIFNPADSEQLTPAVESGTVVKTIALVMDQIQGNGMAVLDNININGKVIGKE